MTASLEPNEVRDASLKRASRQVELVELAVFLLLIVPAMASSFFVIGQERVRFVAEAISPSSTTSPC